MHGTSGQPGTTSLTSAALQSLLESRLRLRSTGSILYSLTWKERVTPSGRSICALRASKARISGSDYILQGFNTPRATDGTNGGPNQAGGALPHDASLAGWPTTTTRDHKDGSSEGTVPLNSLLGRQVWLSGWPTTNATDSTGAGRQGREGGANLQTAAAETQMPQGPMRLCSDGTLLTGSTAGMESGGRLNPAHSRWLMRLPPEWDACVPTETRSTRKRQPPSAQPSGKSAMEYDL